MHAARPDVQYFTYSLNELLVDEPRRLAPMLGDLARRVVAGAAKPLPMKVFEMRGELQAAFGWLRGGHSIGKVVVRVDSPAVIKGAAIITGGLGGLGLLTAEALVELGASRIVLVSRSGKVKHADQNLAERLDWLQTQSGVTVTIERCSTAREAEVVAMLDRVRREHGPLSIIVHAAGVLADKALLAQDGESVSRVFAPKASGAWFLHKHTLQDKLQSFVMFSSIASLFGSPGQANYAAANAFMDSLADLRQSQSLPAVSIQWPGIADVGMAAAMDKRVRMDRREMLSLRDFKLVMKQLVCADSASEAVQAVLTRPLLEADRIPGCLESLMSDVKVRAAMSRSSCLCNHCLQIKRERPKWHTTGTNS